MATTQFGTALNCMDGRTQDAVKQFLQERYGVEYVDQITEPGIVRVIAGVIKGRSPNGLLDGKSGFVRAKPVRRDKAYQVRYGAERLDGCSRTDRFPAEMPFDDRPINQSEPSIGWLRRKVSISIDHHHSQQIAVVAHAECAGNPVDRTIQLAQLRMAVQTVQAWQPTVTVVGLWVEPKAAQWSVQLIE